MRSFRAAAELLITGIRINAICREQHDGRMFFVKRRRAIAAPVLALANAFFRLASARVLALTKVDAWQRWEVDSFQRLHSPRFRAFAIDPGTVLVEELPGVNLTPLLDNGAMDGAMAAAAGRELRRAHALHCSAYEDFWSHGDPHVGNFVFDAAESCARLIDFEVMHDRTIPAPARHADDVLVVLQDMLGRAPRDRWISFARAFIEGYDCAAIAASAVQQLDAPSGAARFWWGVRTSWLPEEAARERIRDLRAALS